MFAFARAHTVTARRAGGGGGPPRGGGGGGGGGWGGGAAPRVAMERFLIPSQGARKRAGDAHAAADATAGAPPHERRPRPPARASFVQCPCCGRSVPDVLINAHLDAGCDGGSQAQTQTQTQTQLATQGVTPQTHRPGAGLRADAGRDSTGGDESQEAPQAASRVPPPTASPEGRKKPKGNALAALMTGARKAATRRERFHLGRDAATGRWKCSWTSGKAECEAAAASAWSATMVIKESSAGECVLTLSTDFAPDPQAVQKAEPAVRPRVPPALAKSVLQKAVRRCRSAATTRAAWHIACSDVGQLVRRLPVVVIEDAVLHPSMPFLCWMAAAQGKGYCPPAAMLHETISIAAQLAEVRVRDPVAMPTQGDTSPPTLASLNERAAAAAAAGDKGVAKRILLVRALLLRKALGGMHGDVAMMEASAALWQRRLLDRDVEPPPAAQLSCGSVLFRSALGAAECGIAPAPSCDVKGDWMDWLERAYDGDVATGTPTKARCPAEAEPSALLSLRSIGALQPVDCLPAAVGACRACNLAALPRALGCASAAAPSFVLWVLC